jgi:hypothetical protein
MEFQETEPEQAMFLIGGALSIALTVIAALSGKVGAVQILLFATFSLFLLGGGIQRIYETVPEYERTAGMILGGVGLIALVVGSPSVLPALFVLGGVAAYFRLW